MDNWGREPKTKIEDDYLVRLREYPGHFASALEGLLLANSRGEFLAAEVYEWITVACKS